MAHTPRSDTRWEAAFGRLALAAFLAFVPLATLGTGGGPDWAFELAQVLGPIALASYVGLQLLRGEEPRPRSFLPWKNLTHHQVRMVVAFSLSAGVALVLGQLLEGRPVLLVLGGLLGTSPVLVEVGWQRSHPEIEPSPR